MSDNMTIIEQNSEINRKRPHDEEIIEWTETVQTLGHIPILYNGEDHYDAIKLVLPALTKKFILIIDDWNWEQVRKGTLESIHNEKLKIVSKFSALAISSNFEV